MAYVPERGDAIWIDFDPRRGREQSGHRPALILSPERFNRETNLAICCPITSRKSRNQLELPLPAGRKVKGTLLVHQVRSVDWRDRGARHIETLPNDIVENALKILDAILDFPSRI